MKINCRYLLIALILSLFSTTIGCGPIRNLFKSKKSTPPSVKRVFMHGDPLSLIENTTKDEKSIFETAKLAEFNKFTLAGGAIFRNISEFEEEEGTVDIEAENAPTKDESDKKLESYSFVEEGGTFVYKSSDSENKFSLNFVNKDGFLELQSLIDYPAKVHHYSLNATKDAFSLLFEVSSGSTQGLYVLYFTRIYENATRPTPTDKKYSYLRGPGVISAWASDINLDFCNVKDPSVLDIFKVGAQAWTKSGKVGSRKFTFGVKENVKPFSDLNQQCMTFVNDFLFEDSEKTAVGGTTATVIDPSRQLILGSSILISKKGLEKMGGSTVYMLITVIHEIGHFLGLDHEFTKDAADNPLYPSIMSYEWDRTRPSEHDKAAIEQLYGAYPPSKENLSTDKLK